MSGGLLQIASFGSEDIYLTRNPEITFFKKVYRRHTNFSLEMKNISLNQIPTYGEEFTVTIGNIGDLLNQSFLEVDLPLIKFYDETPQFLNDVNNTNFNFTELKKKEENELDILKKNFEEKYENLKNFANIELLLYQRSVFYLQADDITIFLFKNIMIIIISFLSFGYQESGSRTDIISKIDPELFSKIDIVTYIENLPECEDDNVFCITTDMVKRELKKKYDIILENLKYYHSNINYYQKKIEELELGEINYNWSEYLGHNLFEFFEIEIGGKIIDRYTKDKLHIQQLHKIDNNKIDNYLNMIGHTDELNMFYSKKNKKYKLYIPLIFWFCKESLNSLPLVAMQYSDIVIRAKLSPLKDILFFKNLKERYKKFLIIDLPLEKIDNKLTLNSKLKYDKFDVLKDLRMVRYYCNCINDELLKKKIPNFTEEKLSLILPYSSSNDSTLLENDFYNLFRNINPKSNILISSDDNNYMWYKLFGRQKFLNYELLYSRVQDPEISFIGDFIYLDDVEREKFCTNNLEYVIELNQENLFKISNNINNLLFNNELDFSNSCKELFWFFKLDGFYDGFDKYDNKQVFNYKVNFKNFIKKFNIFFSKEKMFYQENVFEDNLYKYVDAYNYLNNMIPEGVYFKSFCLYPEKSQPSGSVNFSHLTGKTIRIEFNNDFIDFYFNKLNNYLQKDLKLFFITTSYNIFKVSNGQGNIIFNN